MFVSKIIKFAFAILTVIAFSNISLKANSTKPWYDGLYFGGGLGYVPGGIDAKDDDGEWVNVFPNDLLINVFTGYELLKAFNPDLDYLDIELGLGYGLEKEKSETYNDGGPDGGTTYHQVANSSTYNLSIALKPKYAIKNHEQHVVFGILSLKYFYGTINFRENEDGETYVDTYSLDVTGMLNSFGLGYEYKANSNHSLIVNYTYNTSNLEVNYEDNTSEKIKTKDYNQFNVSYKYTLR